MTTPIPGPTAYPIIGNLLDLQDEVPLNALERIADVYGPIYKLYIRGEERVFVCSFDLFDELCDEARFWKVPPRALDTGKPRSAVGLFGAKSENDDDWGQAHRILMPAFGPMAIQGMFDEMYDIASQLVLKWARKGDDYKIPVTSDFTRLTLDTIALCSMDYRFNSFYQEDLHPFVVAMTNTLASRSNAAQLSGIIQRLLMPSYNAQLEKDVQYMRSVSNELVQHRRDNPTEKKDLLNAMIYGKDPKTGSTMRDDLIAANMQTFLVAGHETTSGLLSFAFLNMLKNPSTYFAARHEVDRVIGRNRIEPKHLNDLKYINAVLRETLRLTPTAPAITRGFRPGKQELNPTVGDYTLAKDGSVVCLISKIQKDPKVFGEDADQFKPERMLDGNFEHLPKNAWKPFGTGMRACIGRAFAWQEALLVCALILQNFDLRLDDPNYEMKIVQTLTIKPKDFYMRVSLRTGITATDLQDRLWVSDASKPAADVVLPSDSPVANGSGEHGKPIQILYGSNTGTSQSFAQKLAARLSRSGWTPAVTDMDAAVNKIKKGGPLIAITASYEGQPPDNAASFVAWLESIKDKKTFDGVRYAVFGCGHSDWRSTFQRIPTLVDSSLAEFGGTRLTERGVTDAARGDMYGEFEEWVDQHLLPCLSKDSPEGSVADYPVPELKLELSTQGRASHLQQSVQWGTVLAASSLTAPGQPEKRHMEIQLPSNTTYSVGDYLAVLPVNPISEVQRVIKRFRLPWDGIVSISDAGSTTLPVGTPLPLSELLKGYVELSQPATRKDIDILATHATDPSDRRALLALTKSYTTSVLDPRVSPLDLLETHPHLPLPFAAFLALLPPLKPRHYSISSSPLACPTSCTLTYSVLSAPPRSGLPGRFRGVAGTHLASLAPGDAVQVAVRSTNKLFRPPPDLEATPMVMFCAGAGLAPFRGFVQERAVRVARGGRALAPALLFVGCRGGGTGDVLYREEFEEWARIGAVDVRYAFSRDPGASEGCKYVQDRVLRDRQDVFELWDRGAKIYVCGSREVANEVGVAAREMVVERMKENGGKAGTAEVEAWFEDKRNERFISDIFS